MDKSVSEPRNAPTGIEGLDDILSGGSRAGACSS